MTQLNGQTTEVQLDSIEDALAAIAAGECIIVVDDMARENEGDLIMAASKCTTERMAWIVRHSRCAKVESLYFEAEASTLTLLCTLFAADTYA